MTEVQPSTSRGDDAAELVGEASCSGADGSTYPESIPPPIVPKSPSFFKRLWIRIQILTACSGLWGARGGGLSGPSMSGLASGAQQTQEGSDLSRISASKSTWSEVPSRLASGAQQTQEGSDLSRISASKSTWSEVPSRLASGAQQTQEGSDLSRISASKSTWSEVPSRLASGAHQTQEGSDLSRISASKSTWSEVPSRLASGAQQTQEGSDLSRISASKSTWSEVPSRLASGAQQTQEGSDLSRISASKSTWSEVPSRLASGAQQTQEGSDLSRISASKSTWSEVPSRLASGAQQTQEGSDLSRISASKSTWSEVPSRLASGAQQTQEGSDLSRISASKSTWSEVPSRLASGAQQTQEGSESEVLSRISASKSTWSEVPSRLASGAQQTQEGSESEVSSRISASKSTWSEVLDRYIHHSISVPSPSELSVWEELKESAPDFFDDWDGEHLEVGPLIAEGGQAQIFKAKLKGREEFDFVLKVFKLDAGFSLADLKLHWPRTMRKDGQLGSSVSKSGQERSSRFVFDDAIANIDGGRCFIQGATLLKDGRFAFLMPRYWGDLRTLIDLKVKEKAHPLEVDSMFKNRGEQPLFSFFNSIYIMSQIAEGMQGLHAEGVLHRDLKAVNVLIHDPKDGIIICNVADYECAMFVQGTGFWRAPEVLQELEKSNEDRNDNIWTEKVDVYSFGMTCYEILTGQIPFAGYTKTKWGDVIRGERPSLPNYVFPELRELVEACWHIQPSQRPSFLIIIEKLASLLKET